MMSSRLDFIRPKLLNQQEIGAWFSYKNGESVNADVDIPGLNLGLNTGGEEAVVLRNRRKLMEEIGVDLEHIAFGEQVHGTNIRVVERGNTYAEADALVSNTPGMALAIQVADCAAVLMGDSENKVIGAAHAGWRGAVGNIIPKTIQKMKEVGAKVESINVFISPCLSLENFEVGEEVAVQFPDRFVDRTSFKKPHVNLKGFLKDQLLQQGIPGNQIDVHPECTIANDRFYSYRREGDKAGRMMGVVKLGNIE